MGPSIRQDKDRGHLLAPLREPEDRRHARPDPRSAESPGVPVSLRDPVTGK
jgi:hypothetical protein